MTLTTSMLHFGSGLRRRKLHAWQIGVLLACYNLGLIVALVVLCLVSLNTNLWVSLLLLSPFGLSAFWLWFSQMMLRFYPHLTIHDSVVVAKIGAFPFMAVFLGGLIGLTVAVYGTDIPDWWIASSYYAVVFGGGSLATELAVVVFGLRHKMHLPLV